MFAGRRPSTCRPVVPSRASNGTSFPIWAEATGKPRPPIPPGNHAYRKQAKLLSLDGSHALSVDGSEWTTVAARQDHDGAPHEEEFAPIPARYVGVRGLKPDGPEQPGTQRSIGELEVYE